jgi:hypothetical protein
LLEQDRIGGFKAFKVANLPPFKINELQNLIAFVIISTPHNLP